MTHLSVAKNIVYHLHSAFCTVLFKYILHCITSQKQTIILFFSSRVWCVIFVVPFILIVTTLRRKVELALVPPRSRKQYLSFWLHNETKNVKYCCLTRCENCRILSSLPATSHNQQSRVSKYPLLDCPPLVLKFEVSQSRRGLFLVENSYLCFHI